jgi:hypothetical protein
MSFIPISNVIPTPYESMVNFLSKWVVNSFFLYLLRSSYVQLCATMSLNCPRNEGQSAKKEVYFAHRILDFFKKILMV